MNFGIDKCVKATIGKDKNKRAENINLDEETHLMNLEQSKFYKYLGIEENTEIDHNNMKKVRNEYYNQSEKILKSQLTGKKTSLQV